MWGLASWWRGLPHTTVVLTVSAWLLWVLKDWSSVKCGCKSSRILSQEASDCLYFNYVHASQLFIYYYDYINSYLVVLTPLKKKLKSQDLFQLSWFPLVLQPSFICIGIWGNFMWSPFHIYFLALSSYPMTNFFPVHGWLWLCDLHTQSFPSISKSIREDKHRDVLSISCLYIYSHPHESWPPTPPARKSLVASCSRPSTWGRRWSGKIKGSIKH